MYTIITLGIIGLIIGVVIYLKENSYWDWLIILINAVVGAFIGAVIGAFVAWALPQSYTTEKYSAKLFSLSDNASVSGSFFLGCGQVNGVMQYSFYLQKTDTTYKMYQVDYYEAAIKYCTDSIPYVNITQKYLSKSLWNQFAIDKCSESYATYVFEVPKGSIKNSYELDSN
jgi:hypothetical protein